MSAVSTDAAGTTAEAATFDGRVVAFYLDDARYALPLDRVQEIQQVVAFSEVPGGGMGVLGLVNLRGDVIPAVDLRTVMGLPTRERSLETPMVIAHVDSQRVALVVDGVEDVIEVSATCVQEPPSMHALAAKMICVARLDEGLVYVLDIDALLDTLSWPKGR